MKARLLARVGEMSVACCVGGNPNGPTGTVVDADGDDGEVPRDDIEGRLGRDGAAYVDGAEEEGWWQEW